MVKMLRDIKGAFAKFSPARLQRDDTSGTKSLFGSLVNKVTKAHATARASGVNADGKPGARPIGHALWQKVTGRSPNTDEKMTPQQRAQKLVEKYGSQRAAAKAAGVNRRSFDRALHGENVNKRNAAKIAKKERQDSVRPTNAKKLKDAMTGSPTNVKTGETSPANTFSVYVTIEVSEGKPEERWIYPGRIPGNEGAMDDLDDLVGQGPEAFQDRIQGMLNNYVAGDVTEVHYINW